MIMLTRYMHIASRPMQQRILYFSWYEVLCEVLIWAEPLFLSDFYALCLCELKVQSSLFRITTEKLELGKKGEPCDFQTTWHHGKTRAAFFEGKHSHDLSTKLLKTTWVLPLCFFMCELIGFQETEYNHCLISAHNSGEI